MRVLTISKITVWIGKPRALKRQLVPTAKRMNPPKSKLFNAVACLEIGVMELSHPLGQRSQARCYFRFSLLIINKRWKQLLIRPLGRTCISIRNHFWEAPFQQPLKTASKYSFWWWRRNVSLILEKTIFSYQTG
jgi:hypothetical protein